MEIGSLNPAYSFLHSFLKTFPWWISVLIAIGLVVLLFSLQRLLFRMLKKWALRRQKPWSLFIFNAFDHSIFIFLISASLGLVPYIFPITKDWKKSIHLVAEFLVLLALAIFFQRLFLGAYRRYVLKNESMRTYSGLVRIVLSVAIFSIFFMIFLDSAGLSITPLIASLGVGSVAVAFALQETLASLFAGLYIVTDKPIRVGHFVKLESGEEGFVESVGWRSVRIRMLKNNLVIVPNSKLASGIITNYSLPSDDMNIPIEIGVDYSSDLEKVESVTLEVARDVLKTTAGAVPTFEPTFLYRSLDDWSVKFVIVLRAKAFVDQFLIQHIFIKKIHERFQKEGIVIPFPVQTVHHKDGKD